MSSINLEIEKRIEKAIEDLHAQSRTNIAERAREFNVPYQRLKARWNGRKSKFQPCYTGRKLDPAQEKALCDWFDYND